MKLNLFQAEGEMEGNEFRLPDWIDRETWDAFEEMRKKIKKPLTEFARKRIVNKLEAYRQIADVNEVLAESVEHCWQSVYVTPSSAYRPQIKDYESPPINVQELEHMKRESERMLKKFQEGR